MRPGVQRQLRRAADVAVDAADHPVAARDGRAGPRARVEAVGVVAGLLLQGDGAPRVAERRRVAPTPRSSCPLVRSSEFESGMLTEAFVPLKESALPNRPAVAPAQVAFVIVPLLPLPGLVGQPPCRCRCRTRRRRRRPAAAPAFATVTGTAADGRRVAGRVARDRGERVRAVRRRRRVPGDRVRRGRVLGAEDRRRRA